LIVGIYTHPALSAQVLNRWSSIVGHENSYTNYWSSIVGSGVLLSGTGVLLSGIFLIIFKKKRSSTVAGVLLYC
jgi:hypothetical protein